MPQTDAMKRQQKQLRARLPPLQQLLQGEGGGSRKEQGQVVGEMTDVTGMGGIGRREGK